MPLRLVNLDDLTWEKLNAEARSLIPARSKEWTDHNPSDPGITLVELFAHFTEILIYELNRISRNNVITFLRLINGSHWKPKDALELEKRTAVLAMRLPHRAVTAEDFEQLTLAVNRDLMQSGRAGVARAKCLFDRNLEDSEKTTRNADAPNHVSIVIVPTRGSHAGKELLRRVRETLEPARLLTTRLHTVPPSFVKLAVRIELVARSMVDPGRLRDETVNRIETFFDPLVGGVDGKGWPFGRSVYVSELYQLLDRIPGVEYVNRSTDRRSGEELDELSVDEVEEHRLRYNAQEELEAVDLLPHELVSAQIKRDDIAVVSLA